MASEQTQDIITEIAAERERQITQERWTIEHDDQHQLGAMSRAAATYAIHWISVNAAVMSEELWPFENQWFKPKNPRRDLIRAAALIVAEIERLDRQSTPAKDEG